jgi:hypothetical protein
VRDFFSAMEIEEGYIQMPHHKRALCDKKLFLAVAETIITAQFF